MLVLVCADQRSATNYLAAIVQIIMKKAGLKTCMEDNRFLKPANTRNTVYTVNENTLGFLVTKKLNSNQCQNMITKGLVGNTDEKTLVFSKSYDALEVTKGTNLLQTHILAGAFEKNKIWPDITRIIYGHRDGRDSTTSALRYHSISNDKDYSRAGGLMQSKNHRKDTAFWYYGIKEPEIKFCTYTISWQIARWRKHLMDSLLLKEKYPEKIFYTLYSEFTGENEIQVIKDIIANLKIGNSIQAEEIFHTIKTFKKKNLQNKNKERSLNMLSTSKKYGKAADFLPSENISFMEKIAGDALVCGGYLPLQKLNPFIAEKDEFVLLVNEDETKLQKEFINCFFKHCGKSVKDTLTSKIDLEEYIKKHGKQNFIICSENIRDYEYLLNNTQHSESKDYTIYPYYEVYKSGDFFLFDINNHLPFKLNQLFGKRLAVITNGTRPEFRDIPISVLYNNGQPFDLYLKIEPYIDCVSESTKRILIFGGGIVGKSLKKYIEDNHPEINLVGFVDSFAQTGEATCEGLPVYNVKDVSNVEIDEVVIASVYHSRMKKELRHYFTGKVSISKISYRPNSHSLFEWGQKFTYCHQLDEKLAADLTKYDCVLLISSCLDDSYYNLREFLKIKNINVFALYPQYDLDFIDIEEDQKYVKIYEDL